MFRLLKLLFIGPEGLREQFDQLRAEWKSTRLELDELTDKLYRQAQRLSRREASDRGVTTGRNGGGVGAEAPPSVLPPRIAARRGL